MRSITLEVLTAPSCARCEAFIAFWNTIAHEWKNITMKEISVMTEEGQALAMQYHLFASPGIIIDNKLFASGGFDQDAVIKKLQELSSL